MRKPILAQAVPYVAKKLSRRIYSKSLERLQLRIQRYFAKYQSRKVEFAALQIACGLMVLGLIKILRPEDCPLTVGSKRGVKRVQDERGEKVSVKQFVEETGREAYSIQTSLCAFDKYRRYYDYGIPTTKVRIAH